ncbi:DUF1311 domain-containing protein [Photobacterium sp. SDRW27]|uniref:lysozyme inhibitor LprI family protein n=1 Tax=Photobacterium obscurum TaxID=2829490 RepID=UPI00224449E1|nr:lysozyme inhibitor LprI family protein [Photobacterium obscurum]MCW8332135.1 DUF1311 domain-containing protein [Photobacterium obscurum]
MVMLTRLSLGLVLFSVPVEASILTQCSEHSEGHQVLTVCLEEAYQQAELQLLTTEIKVLKNMAELDAISSAAIGAEAAFQRAQSSFREWREQQCQFVKASYGSGNGAGQGYLDCLYTLTNEQERRLNEYTK